MKEANVLAINAKGDKAFAISAGEAFNDLIEVDLGRETYKIISSAPADAQNDLRYSRTVLLNEDETELLYWYLTDGASFTRVNLQNGERSKINYPLNEQNVNRWPYTVIFGQDASEVIIGTLALSGLRDERPVVERVYLETGNREVLSEGSVDLSTDFGLRILNMAWNLEQTAIFAATNYDGAIFQIDPNTGNKTLITGRGRGTGPHLYFTTSLVPLPGGNKILAMDTGLDALVEIDLATGDRTIFSY